MAFLGKGWISVNAHGHSMNVMMANLFDIVSLEYSSPAGSCSLLEAFSIGLCKLHSWVPFWNEGNDLSVLWNCLMLSHFANYNLIYLFRILLQYSIWNTILKYFFKSSEKAFFSNSLQKVKSTALDSICP